jgi:hypothetical protein
MSFLIFFYFTGGYDFVFSIPSKNLHVNKMLKFHDYTSTVNHCQKNYVNMHHV